MDDLPPDIRNTRPIMGQWVIPKLEDQWEQNGAGHHRAPGKRKRKARARKAKR